jgi:prolipoprotein diacylglyceryltransferase
VLLDGQPGRWLHAATLPTLLVLAGGKLAMAAGGRGQGQPWDGDWATAYLGPGPWGSLAPQLPSHPAQVYEALATVAVLVVVMAFLAIPGVRQPDGRAFLIAIGAWAVARAIVASWWRDPVATGPLRLEQALDVAIAAAALLLLVLVLVRERRTGPIADFDSDDVDLTEPTGP